MRDWWLQTFQHFLDYCPLIGTIVESRRATDQAILKKVAVVFAVPLLTAVASGLVVWGAMGAKEHADDLRMAELSHRIERLEAEIRETHNKIVAYMLQHAENDRREFNDLRKK